jgi:hypothetical protein
VVVVVDEQVLRITADSRNKLQSSLGFKGHFNAGDWIPKLDFSGEKLKWAAEIVLHFRQECRVIPVVDNGEVQPA